MILNKPDCVTAQYGNMHTGCSVPINQEEEEEEVEAPP